MSRKQDLKQALKSLRFVLTGDDRSSGMKTWNIQIYDPAVSYNRVIGWVEKSTEWCGEGYRASGYELFLDLLNGEEINESFDVGCRKHHWDAREALKACKDRVRDLIQAGIVVHV